MSVEDEIRQVSDRFYAALKAAELGHLRTKDDPMVFHDPGSDKCYLYWGSGFQPIKVQELADDRMSFAPDSEPIDLIWPNPVKGAFPRLVEACWVIRHGDFHYLFYSGGSYLASYGMGYATSESPTEGFAKSALNPILAETADVLSPGGGSVTAGPAPAHTRRRAR